jgi:catechol 2,3-dioxygenase-like lactoylglutathione lyase family enzyme
MILKICLPMEMQGRMLHRRGGHTGRHREPAAGREEGRAKGGAMRRLHVALAVDDLDATIRDYRERLGADPVAVVPGTYALWRTPEVNLSVNAVAGPGVVQRLRHLGFEDDTAPAASESVDVNGITWEAFNAAWQDAGIVEVYGPPFGSTEG